MPKLKIAMIAPPWLSIPPKGYGGIELVVEGLVSELQKMGHDVTLFTIGDSTLKGVKLKPYYKDEQYLHIHKPVYQSAPVPIAQVAFALNEIQKGNFDIIHDHNPFIGPLALHWATMLPDMPPAVHTLHGPPFSDTDEDDLTTPDNTLMWRQLGKSKRLYYIGISDALSKAAPAAMKPQILKSVHNAVDVNLFPFQAKKKNHFITLARFSREKGEHTAARLCDKLGYRLQMAGTVAGINSPRQLLLALANPLSEYRQYADFKYYHDFVWPVARRNPLIKYVGNLGDQKKLKFISEAKALLNPIDWEEPFGLAPIEALACGTPVVAMNRGAMPEIIEHGVNGFLANSVYEFQQYMEKVDEIDPAACRESVKKKFSLPIMAQSYLDRYNQVLAKDKGK
jgi:glycosyltransferase involved in cell wall biosynthesis